MNRARFRRWLPLLGWVLALCAAPGHAQYSPSASVNLSSGYAGMASRLGASQLGREMMQQENADKGAAAVQNAPGSARESAAASSELAAEAQRLGEQDAALWRASHPQN